VGEYTKQTVGQIPAACHHGGLGQWLTGSTATTGQFVWPRRWHSLC
jgi:hypothetical protein